VAPRKEYLRIVAHDRDALSCRLQCNENLRLQAVGVLVLVHQHMVETLAQLARQRFFAHHLGPEDQQVVVVEHVLLLLGFDVGAEQLLEFALPLRAPRVDVLQHAIERLAGVDHARINPQAGAFERKPVLGFRKADVVPHHAHQVLGVAAVVDGERFVKSDARRVLA
jgi:hypothetical protein